MNQQIANFFLEIAWILLMASCVAFSWAMIIFINRSKEKCKAKNEGQLIPTVGHGSVKNPRIMTYGDCPRCGKIELYISRKLVGRPTIHCPICDKRVEIVQESEGCN